MTDGANIRAVIFDVFGTLVDWRSSIAREVDQIAAGRGWDVDGELVADTWRAGYQPAMERVRSGERPYVSLDVLHREILDEMADSVGLGGLTEAERRDLTRAWHRLDPWPDVVGGLARLRETHLIAPCSNGHIALVVNLSRHCGITWDAITGAELAGTYKTEPHVYHAAARAFDCAEREVMMVACHSWDLEAAAAVGMRTCHVARPDEKGPGMGEAEPLVPVDLAVRSIRELADRMA